MNDAPQAPTEDMLAKDINAALALARQYKECDARIYAMVVLAERHKLPADSALVEYGDEGILQLRYTAIYCAGINGDHSAVRELVRLYPTSPGTRTQEMIATALAELGDPTGVPTLEGDAYRDRGQLTSKRDLDLLKQLGIDYTLKAP